MKRSGPPRRKTPLRAKKSLDRGAPLERSSSLRPKSEMKRSTGLARSAELDRSTELKPRSDERQKLMKEHRIPAIEAMVAEGRRCEIGPVLAHHGLDGGRSCIGRIEGLHELRKRSAGGSLINPANLMPACNPCNGWVEDYPEESHILGFVVREGDEGYEELGKRNDISLAASP